MGHWESKSKSSEHYTPKYIFDALNCEFDIDVAAPKNRSRCFVPAKKYITSGSLKKDWGVAFVWMNPPFGGRNQKTPSP